MPALSSRGCRFDPGSCQLVEAIGGKCGHYMVQNWHILGMRMYLAVSLVGHVSNRLSMVSLRAEPKNWIFDRESAKAMA